MEVAETDVACGDLFIFRHRLPKRSLLLRYGIVYTKSGLCCSYTPWQGQGQEYHVSGNPVE